MKKYLTICYLLNFVFLLALHTVLNAQNYPFQNKTLSPDSRTNDLMERLSIEEKISLLCFRNAAIPRLDIPAYNWWNEGLHGVARAGEATVFPQAIGMAASFDPVLLLQVADAISTEARAKYNLFAAQDRHSFFMGLSLWSPNINIFRDPRWGRGQETYGEDPFLTATMGTAFVKGIQGPDLLHLKAAACAKHYAVHSGPEASRHSFNAVVDEKDLRETYLYAFKKLTGAGVASVMCAYNSVNGEACCTSNALLKNILLKEWKFKGQVVTDCGALNDIMEGHKLLPTKEAVAAAAVKSGVNLECGSVLRQDVQSAMKQGLLTEADINTALRPTLMTAMRLGLYQRTPEKAYQNYTADSVHNTWHIDLARKMATESIVLLKNSNVLPLDKNKLASLYITGPNAASVDVLAGSYHGLSSGMVTFTEGITRAAGAACAVSYEPGCDNYDTTRFVGMMLPGLSEATVAVLGLNPQQEGEEGDAFLAAADGDKNSLSIPRSQLLYLQQLRKASKKLIVVLTSGSAIDIAAIEPYADAIILAWYPGEQGGIALADILFGSVSPSGRLPVTLYASLQDIPDFNSYSMQGRTYRYYSGKAQYPFGYGLSYTSFNYSWKQKPLPSYRIKDSISVELAVANSGQIDGDEVVQAYISYPALERMPLKELKAFKRVSVARGSSATVRLTIPVSELQKWDMDTHSWKLYPGTYHVAIGKNADDMLLTEKFTIR